MVLTRLEVNLKRLLVKCELMVKNNQKDDERFPQYITSLTEMLQNLIDSQDAANCDIYSQRIDALKTILSKKDMVDTKVVSGGNDAKETDIPSSKTLSARQELLGSESSLRQRSTNISDLDEVLEYHRTEQEKIAENMLSLTRSLKEQSQLANRIIKQDTEVISKSSVITDKNFSKLKTESEKLTEHSKRACKCWMWIMLIIVMIVFINMVLFMKVMKKSV